MPDPVRRTTSIVTEGAKVGILLTVPALIAWVTGRPLIFPSLGPSAFALMMDRNEEITARQMIGSHLVGVICGFLTFNVLAYGFSVTELPSSLSPALLKLAASGVISVVLTTVVMLAARIPHAPACATTMIVSLGLLSTFADGFFIMLAVLVMYAVHRLFVRIGFQRGKKR